MSDCLGFLVKENWRRNRDGQRSRDGSLNFARLRSIVEPVLTVQSKLVV
jgi:hypothetical protein